MSRTRRKKDNPNELPWYGDNPDGRDRKPWCKPNSEFKKHRRKQRRAKARQALRDDKEVERERHNDVWDWN